VTVGSNNFRIRLRVGIAVMFLSVMLPLTALMTGILYRQNSQLAVQQAEAAMDSTTRDVVAGVGAVLGPMGRLVDLSVAFGKTGRDSLRRLDSLRPLVESLDHFPDLYALFFGFAHDGAFYEVIRVPAPETGLTLKGRHPPPGARYALRIIDTVDGERVDSWIYIAQWGKVVGVEQAPKAIYDPRPRPWFKAAMATKEIATSGLHMFSSVDRPGMTLSRQLATDDGQLIAVFGADLATDTLSHVLAEHRVGSRGVVFIMDEDQRLLGHPEPERVFVQEGKGHNAVKAADFNDPVLADAVKRRNSGAGDRFHAKLGTKGAEYLVSFTRFPEDFGKNWTIGVIAAEADFVGPLRRASLIILLIGVAFLGMASLAVLSVSRVLTRPIQSLTEETQRIRNLDLTGEIKVQSGVLEVQTLAEALDTMKTALRSFSAYVPKGVLKGIIETGVGTEVGGERRQLTVMFSDIKGFTATSENMVPEDLLNHLSLYLEGIAEAIDANNGTIDKFIGDAVMALWNAPQLDSDHAANACRAVLACHAATRLLNADLVANNYPPLPTRFGLHTGVTVVGNVGCYDRMQYTALGATVNLASRVEALNKRFGTEMLVTGAVEQVVRGKFVFRPMGAVVASGTSVPIPMFELVGAVGDAPHAASPADLDRVAAWHDGFTAYEAADWPRAAMGFRAYLGRYPDDVAARLLLDHAQANAAAPDAAEPILTFAEK
jgi:adenylate cyclase